ncbi:hypothetical protein BX600DRAFT_477860 [Xylariales sp. PMI_506]|nr:hypothetical protein BX600DRAFT_477860 [Xylariales sp. PMI_506]
MQYLTLLSMALGLASAAPVKRSTLTGTNAGSLYSFDAAATAREIFYEYGSCGLSTYFVGVVPDSMPLVAMPSTVMQNYGASQHNTLCGKIVTMTNSAGVTQQAAVADTNVSVDNSIDMTIDLWVNFGQSSSDASIIPSLSWSIDLDGTSTGSSGTGSSGTCTETYTVVSGDYCYKIWNDYGITEAELYAWNPTLDSACDLAIGQVLCVAE